MAPEPGLTVLSRLLAAHPGWTITEAGPVWEAVRPEPALPCWVTARSAASLEAKLDRLAEAEMHAPRGRA
jgi:hypothetical protein